MKNVLFLGESWSINQSCLKGCDNVVSGHYEEYGSLFMNAFKEMSLHFDYMPNHIAQVHFPFQTDALKKYDVIILSDIGSNTFLLHPDTLGKCERLPNRLEVIKQYVAEGGGLLTIGGYMSYSGIDAKARYAMTPLAEVMPVKMLHYDDRIECPEGVIPRIINQEHPVLDGIAGEWPYFLGYNRIMVRPEAELIATVNEDVFMASMSYGKGRSFAFASDCVPHWAPPGFLTWEHYTRLFDNIICWLSGDSKK